ncbi:hypothetical protein N7492_006705 [Penicillium capsulatum]|uniref:Uncharacterized protein n=1 Tax=Penicillium capsulatum TaxID=69766 RepID=A0A9W9LL50_9EURO|nr:hypothetical protein N7492_006705 [Penicillium capsulatum]
MASERDFSLLWIVRLAFLTSCILGAYGAPTGPSITAASLTGTGNLSDGPRLNGLASVLAE